MLLKSFNRVAEIDEKIKNLHTELASVYQERLRIVSGNNDIDQASGTTALDFGDNVENANDWVGQQYYGITKNWKTGGLKPPTLKHLERRLKAAKKILVDFDMVYGEGFFSLLLVPPVAKFGLAQLGQMTNETVYLPPELSGEIQKDYKNWRLFVVMNTQNGIEMTDPDEFMLEQNFMISGHPMDSLDLQAYLALIATTEHSIDVDSWSILLSQHDTDTGIVPCIAKIGDSYRFEIDSVDALIGQNHFRPALEIK